MQKIVINSRHGGFGLSDEAMRRYAEIKKIEDVNSVHIYDICRDDPALVQVVEELGEKSHDRYSELRVVEIPDRISWIVLEYDGLEHVAEQHRTWY
ncbi:MAG: hypothetical protein WCH46_11480 [bacterium]|jgi:hypothetical protein